jgi:hypothetical protein
METRLSTSQFLPNGGHWLCGSAADARGEIFTWEVGGEIQSMVWATRGPQSRFAKITQLSDAALDRSLAIEAAWVRGDGIGIDLGLQPALYRALQQGRIWNCNSVVAHVANLDGVLAQALHLTRLQAAPEYRGGQANLAAVQMLDWAIFNVAKACSAGEWLVLRKGLVPEAMATVRAWANESFFKGSWTQAILRKTMTREQYVQSLSNMHQHVRQTTPHLGRAIGCAGDLELRRHLISHLNGEINHEVSLENDLRHLGEDPEYTMHHRMPNSATKVFMAVQEAAIAFYQDPVLFMASPLAAEGLSAHIPPEFLTSLRLLLVSWGVARPERAMSFLASHVHHDGGDDGHWAATTAILEHYLVDEASQRSFLCTLRAAADSLENSFNSSVDELTLFSEANEKGTLRAVANQ